MTSRTGKVGEAARRVTEAIAAAKKGKQEPKPIAYLLDRLEQKVSQLALAATSRSNEALLENHYQQVCWLIDHGHYNAALSLGRELYVTYFLLKAYPEADYKNAGLRQEAENWLKHHTNYRNSVSDCEQFPIDASHWTIHLNFFSKLRDLRNDVQHAGMRPQEVTFDTVLSVCNEMRRELLELISQR